MLPFLAYLIVLLLLTVATGKIKNERFAKLREYVAKNIMWGWMLGFITESFLVISISCFANFTNFTFESTGKIVSSICT